MEFKITVQISKRTRYILKDTVILKLIYKGRLILKSKFKCTFPPISWKLNKTNLGKSK